MSKFIGGVSIGIIFSIAIIVLSRWQAAEIAMKDMFPTDKEAVYSLNSKLRKLQEGDIIESKGGDLWKVKETDKFYFATLKAQDGKKVKIIYLDNPYARIENWKEFKWVINVSERGWEEAAATFRSK